jgi:hypothetical protein
VTRCRRGFLEETMVALQTWGERMSVGDHRIPRQIGEDRGGEIGPVHHSPVKIWAGGTSDKGA